MGFAGAALQALAAGDVHLGGNEVAFFYAGHFVAECDDLAAKFVSGDERRLDAALGPAVPLVDVEVGAADGGDFYFYQDFVASVGWDGDFSNFRARRGLWFHYCLHRAGHGVPYRYGIYRSKRFILHCWGAGRSARSTLIAWRS